MGVGRRWPDTDVFSMPMMMLSAACGLQPQIGSAFQRVVPSRSENLLPSYLPILPSAAFQRDEKPLCGALKEEDLFENSDDLPGNKDPDRLLPDGLKTTENELPFKKRKPRFADSKMGDISCEQSCEDYLNQGSSDCGAECLSPSVSSSDNHCQKCIEMHHAERDLSLVGRFTSWTAVQVQLWLWKTLREPPYKLPASSVCELLKSIRDYDGNSLATLDREDWQKLSGSGVPADVVWLNICERVKLDSAPFKPYNYCEFMPQRETGKTNRMKACSATKTPKMTLPKKATKPRRRRDKCVGQLWEFVYNLLENKQTNPSVVCWEDRDKLLFRIVNTEEIARLWGAHKGNTNMTYANMSRTMRYYREGNGAFVRNERKRVYGFGPKADFARLQAKTARILSQ